MEHMATNRPTASHSGNAVSKVHSKTDAYVNGDSHMQHVKNSKKITKRHQIRLNVNVLIS